MDITNTPGLAENIYRQALEVFFARKWGNRMLFSHDINHHRRVWNFARELMLTTENKSNPYSLDCYSKILISCYLHDLGMTVTTGIDHGFHSRNLAAEFLSELNHDLSAWSDMLDAIEKHDNKEYSSGPEEKNNILVILAAADDLDAFGHMGIYRYLEIYIERGVPPEKIAGEIRKNAANRFRNLETSFGKYPAFIEKHRLRYLILDEFFREFGRETGFSI